MAENAYKCVKCNSEMVRGLIAGRYNANYFQTVFVEGEPEHAELFGIQGNNLRVLDKTRYPLRTLRRGHCGYVEIYAV